MTKQEQQEGMARYQALHPESASEKRYKINEIFYSIQGEGLLVGTAAVFIRFSACNLSCSWCDTEYNSGVMLSLETILETANGLWGEARFVPCSHIIVCTGGEPSLQVDPAFTKAFTKAGYQLSMETNGIKWNEAMYEFNLITVSPKTLRGWWAEVRQELLGFPLVLKVVFDPFNTDMKDILRLASLTPCQARFLQPLEHGDSTNAQEVVEYVKKNPSWRMSLQTHKLLDIR